MRPTKRRRKPSLRREQALYRAIGRVLQKAANRGARGGTSSPCGVKTLLTTMV
jgi:hypothetical protein